MQQVADTLAADSLVVPPAEAADTTGSLARLNAELEHAGDLLFTGELGHSTGVLYEGLSAFVLHWAPRLLSALVVFLLLYGLYRALFALLRRGLRRSKYIKPGLETLLLQALRIIGLAFVGITALDQLGFNLAGLGLGLGLAGVAVGFAAKDTVENIISGVTILLDQPFRIGDTIIIQGTYGTVVEITLRSTRLRTPNNEVMVMPNVQMVNNQLLNHAMLNPLRVEIPFSIAYKEHPREARQVVLALTEQDARLHPGYLPEVKVAALAESGMDMVLWLFLKDAAHEMALQYEYKEQIREALRKAHIEIPFPHVQLMVDEPVPLGPAP